MILDWFESSCLYSTHLFKSVAVCTGGYFRICLAFLFVYIKGDTHHLYEMIIIGGGGVFFLITGSLLLVEKIKDLVTCTIIMVAFLLGNGVVMLVDLVREIMDN